MQYVDKDQNPISFSGEIFDFRKLINDMIIFLREEGVPQEILDDIDVESEFYNIMFCNGSSTYTVNYCGEKKEFKFPSTASAFEFLMEQQRVYDGWDMTVGLCFRNMEISKIYHKVVHEMMHAFSTKMKIIFDEKGICYTKNGFVIDSYDVDDNPVDDSLKATGFNEGITEYLASKFCKEKYVSYDLQSLIVEIMCGFDKTMITGYFSRNKEDVINFYKNFDESQEIIDHEELIKMSKNVIYDFDKIFSYLDAAISFSLSHCENLEEYNLETERIRVLVNCLDNNLDYNDTNGTPFLDHVNEFLIKRNFSR